MGWRQILLPNSRNLKRNFKFANFVAAKEEWTLILDDPAGNSYVQNVYAPDDPELKIENYERTFEQNDDLGLNDMKTEGYEEDS